MKRIRLAVACVLATGAMGIGYAALFSPAASAAGGNFHLAKGCAAAQGNVGWQNRAWIGIGVYISNACGSGTEFVRLSWSTPLRHNASVGAVVHGTRFFSQVFNAPHFLFASGWGGIGAVKVTLCNTWLGSTSCGPTASL